MSGSVSSSEPSDGTHDREGRGQATPGQASPEASIVRAPDLLAFTQPAPQRYWFLTRFFARVALVCVPLVVCGVVLMMALWRSSVAFWPSGHWVVFATSLATGCAGVAALLVAGTRSRRQVTSDWLNADRVMSSGTLLEVARRRRAWDTANIVVFLACGIGFAVASVLAVSSSWRPPRDEMPNHMPDFVAWLSISGTDAVFWGLVMGAALNLEALLLIRVVEVARHRRFLTRLLASYGPTGSAAQRPPDHG